MTKKTDITPEHLGQHSKVTPKGQRRFLKQAPMAVLLLLAGAALLCLWLPEKQIKTAEVAQSTSPAFEDTLASNLARLEALKQKAKTVPAKAHYQVRERVRPPKLRHKEHVSKEILLRMNAPVGFNLRTPRLLKSQATPATAGGTSFYGKDRNSRFLNQAGSVSTVAAQSLPHPDFTIAAGEMIPAVLETAINSELPGFTRAITTRDIYSLTDSNCLIPKGSVLIGQFASSLAQGQSRLLVQWMRVARPDGVVVNLQSPGTDALGRAGLGADSINRHFFARFGTASLLSIIGASTATAGVHPEDQYNSAAAYRQALAQGFNQSASQVLSQSINIPPTLEVNQGTLINVFVAHDLDFKAVGAVTDTPVISPLQEGLLWKE